MDKREGGRGRDEYFLEVVISLLARGPCDKKATGWSFHARTNGDRSRTNNSDVSTAGGG